MIDFVPKDISGFVYLDSDNDGVFDSGESGLGGIKVILTSTDPTFSHPDDLEPNVPGVTKLTNADGSYRS